LLTIVFHANSKYIYKLGISCGTYEKVYNLKRYVLRKVAQEHKVLLRRLRNTYSSDVLLTGFSNDL
jgi:hypothetical protein